MLKLREVYPANDNRAMGINTADHLQRQMTFFDSLCFQYPQLNFSRATKKYKTVATPHNSLTFYISQSLRQRNLSIYLSLPPTPLVITMVTQKFVDSATELDGMLQRMHDLVIQRK